MLSKVVRSSVRTGIKGMSTVASQTIHVTFVDQEGNRAKFPARIGQTLLEVAKQNKIDLEGPCLGGGAPPEVARTSNWTEFTYGEGPSCFTCHVQIPPQFRHLLPPQLKSEIMGLDEVWEDEQTAGSRLACQITLERKHDGLVVLVPDAPPTDVV